jgi:hypothetical protein
LTIFVDLKEINGIKWEQTGNWDRRKGVMEQTMDRQRENQAKQHRETPEKENNGVRS